MRRNDEGDDGDGDDGAGMQRRPGAAARVSSVTVTPMAVTH